MSKLVAPHNQTKSQIRERRTRAKLAGSKYPRLSVFRSNKYVYAQIIDVSGKSLTGSRNEISKKVGQDIAEKAIKLGVSQVVFDRGAKSYHGKIKQLAEAAREAGLKF